MVLNFCSVVVEILLLMLSLLFLKLCIDFSTDFFSHTILDVLIIQICPLSVFSLKWGLNNKFIFKEILFLYIKIYMSKKT